MTNKSIDLPSIAQLVERRTVEVKLISLGRWFKSGSKETFFYFSLDASLSFCFLAVLSFLFYLVKTFLTQSTLCL